MAGEIIGQLANSGSVFGEPVKPHTPWRHRYTQAPVAIANGSEEVLKLIRDGRMSDPTHVRDSLLEGRMPRRGGIMHLGHEIYASCDLMAAQLLPRVLELNPALKSVVDPETKMPQASGLIVLTRFVLARSGDCEAVIRGVQPVAEAFNPDVEPWKADHYAQQGQRVTQNDRGIAIAQLDVLSIAEVGRRPVILDQQAGSATIQLGR
ncbi:MAG: hypothetical protein U0520_03230 [Candidatus Saccharimonadales bacterium]